MLRLLIYLTIWLVYSVSRAAPPPDLTNWSLVFHDEFDSLDDRFWTIEDNIERQGAINSKSQVRVDDGKLILSARTINNKHYVGFVKSENKVEFQNGYLELRAKIKPVEGAWIDWWFISPGMFTNKTDRATNDKNQEQELDVFEIRKIDKYNRYIGGGLFRCIHSDFYWPDLKENCEGVYSPDLSLD